MDSEIVFGVLDKRTGRFLGRFFRSEKHANTHASDNVYATGIDENNKRFEVIPVSTDCLGPNDKIED